MRIDYKSEDFREAAERAGFKSIEEAIRVVSKLTVEGAQDVLEGRTETDVPLSLWLLAGQVQKESGIKVEAIRKSKSGSWRKKDGSSVPLDQLLRIMSKEKTPEQLGIHWQERQAWFFGTTGNPVTLERFLRYRGYHALATSPNWVEVCEVGKETKVDPELAREEREYDKYIEEQE